MQYIKLKATAIQCKFQMCRAKANFKHLCLEELYKKSKSIAKNLNISRFAAELI